MAEREIVEGLGCRRLPTLAVFGASDPPTSPESTHPAPREKCRPFALPMFLIQQFAAPRTTVMDRTQAKEGASLDSFCFLEHFANSVANLQTPALAFPVVVPSSSSAIQIDGASDQEQRPHPPDAFDSSIAALQTTAIDRTRA